MKLVSARMFIFLLALSPAIGLSQGATDNPRGADLFRLCTACHGQNGEGKQSVAAPAIAGMPEWYVLNQLKKFKTGVRGTHAKDVAGMRMRPMAKTLKTDADMLAVSKYVASLPKHMAEPTFHGNALAGEKAYLVCITCHGKDGAGNKTLSAPPLVGQNDWYLMTQIKHFKGGIRGGNATVDPTGAQMPAMARLLADDQAVKDVIAYINTLK